MLESTILEKEQKDLLAMLVEAARNLPRDKREPFDFMQLDGGSLIMHGGLPDKKLMNVYDSDIEILIQAGLILPSYGSRGQMSRFDVTPLGFKYYENMKQQAGQPVQRIETVVRDYLEAEYFQQKYPEPYQKWAEAEAMLWESDSERQLTTIGHLCREAMQEFITVLVDQYQPPQVDSDKAHTVARFRAVLEIQAAQLSTTERPYLEALLGYWGTVSDLIQRQEHGGQKEGEPLVWEDGRRVVFQTAVVMFEIDKSLSRSR
jgi:hypothetical protein